MEYSNAFPEESAELAEIRRYVRMDHLLAMYEYLSNHMMLVHSSELPPTAFESLIPERFIIVLPSPFPAPDGRINHESGHFNVVIVYLENNIWEHPLGLRSVHIPNDVIGFVMAYEGCSYQDAVTKLSALAAEIQQSNQEELERDIADIRRGLELMAARSVTTAEASKIQGQILRRLNS